ncbi:MAG: 2Fe-2S iron-sulfur cluster-binding protein [Stellaceae bacterium]
MFRPRYDRFAATVRVTIEGRQVLVPAGASAAAAMLAAGLRGSPAPYCMIGVCFNCLAEIDGSANRQSCMVAVRQGMRIRRQSPARSLDPAI